GVGAQAALAVKADEHEPRDPGALARDGERDRGAQTSGRGPAPGRDAREVDRARLAPGVDVGFDARALHRQASGAQLAERARSGDGRPFRRRALGEARDLAPSPRPAPAATVEAPPPRPRGV